MCLHARGSREKVAELDNKHFPGETHWWKQSSSWCVWAVDSLSIQTEELSKDVSEQEQKICVTFSSAFTHLDIWHFKIWKYVSKCFKKKLRCCLSLLFTNNSHQTGKIKLFDFDSVFINLLIWFCSGADYDSFPSVTSGWCGTGSVGEPVKNQFAFPQIKATSSLHCKRQHWSFQVFESKQDRSFCTNRLL